MSDRLSAANGKRDPLWGTLKTCPACGRCLCYGCHPRGPCVDDRAAATRIHSRDEAAAAQTLVAHA